MNIVMDWGTLNINVPRDEMLLIQSTPVEVRQLDLTEFRYAMHDKQDDEAGIAYLDMHSHNPPVEVSGVSLAQVVQIINNYTVTFEDGLYNVNIVGGNSNISDNTIKNQVGVNTSNSAGLQDSVSLQAASFGGEVAVDAISGTPGTTFPIGTKRSPCSNVQDAVTISKREGIDTILFQSDYTLTTGDNVEKLHLMGSSHVISDLIVEPGAECLETSFSKFTISGTLDGDSDITDCIVMDIEYFNGHIHDCSLGGTITLAGSKDALLDDCRMLNIMVNPVIDAGGSSQNLIMSNYTGVLELTNTTDANQYGIGISAGDVIVDSSCVGGIIALSGDGTVTDNSQPNCYVIDKLSDGTELANLQRVIEYLRPHHTGSGEIIYWDPYAGSDVHHGDAPDRAFKTFAVAHAVAENANHDTIMIIAGNPAGVTVITEPMNITKDYLFIRGPGRDVVCNYNGTGITTTARGTEFSGFRIGNTGVDSIGIESSGDFTLVEDVWLENCYNALKITGSHPVIKNCDVFHPLGYGIKLQGNIRQGTIENCRVGAAGTNGMEIDTYTGYGGITLNNCVFADSEEYGLVLSATTKNTIVDMDTVFHNNTLGKFNDLNPGNNIIGTDVTVAVDFEPTNNLIKAEHKKTRNTVIATS